MDQHEPFGLVALESLRAGTPVTVSKKSGVAEAIANLVTVDFWDVNDIADKMLGPDEPARLVAESYAAAIATR